MKTIILITLISAAFVGFSVADDKVPQKKGRDLLPPRFVEFLKLDREKEVLHISEYESNTLDLPPEIKKALPDEIKNIATQWHYAVSLEHIRFALADGTQIDINAARKRMSRGSVIVMSSNGKMIAERYRRLLKDDSLILFIDSEHIPHPPELPKYGVSPEFTKGRSTGP